MPIGTQHLAALGAVDYDANGSVTPADQRAAQRDAATLDFERGGPIDVIDHRDAAAFAQTLLRAPGNERASLAQSVNDACVRLRRGAGAMRDAGHFVGARDVGQACERLEAVPTQTPAGPHPVTAQGTARVSGAALRGALAVGAASNPMPRGLLQSAGPALTALETLLASAPDNGAIASPAAEWGPLLDDTPPSGPVDRLLYDLLGTLRDQNATLYASRRPTSVFADSVRTADELREITGLADPIEHAVRVYLAWPNGGARSVSVPLEGLTGVSGSALNVERNASFRLLRLQDGTVVMDSFRGVGGNWRTGWANLQSAVFADTDPAPYAAFRASFLGAPVRDAGMLGAWGYFGEMPDSAGALSEVWSTWEREHRRASIADGPPSPDAAADALQRYRRLEAMTPRLLELEGS